MHEYIKILGCRVSDLVTGFKGTVTSVSFDLYGCVQCIVTPDDNGKDTRDSRWFDYSRLTLLNAIPVMNQPDFVAQKGPQEKPAK